MLIRAYLPQFLTALFGGLFIALGVFSFGNAQIFDRLFLGVLIFTGIVCRENINVVSVVIILFLQATISELAWFVLYDNTIIKLILYTFSFMTCYLCRHDKIIRLVTPILVILSLTEIYWLISGYLSPETFWYIWLIVSTLGVRYLLMFRVSFLNQYFSKKGESIHLDWAIFKITAFFILIQILMLFEYFVRHIFNLPEVIFIYTLYPYAIQGLTTLSIWVIFHESYKLLLPKFLKV